MKDQIHVLNSTDFEYDGYGVGDGGEKYVKTIPRPANGGSYDNANYNLTVNRTKRNEPLLNKDDGDQVPTYYPFYLESLSAYQIYVCKFLLYM